MPQKHNTHLKLKSLISFLILALLTTSSKASVVTITPGDGYSSGPSYIAIVHHRGTYDSLYLSVAFSTPLPDYPRF